MRALIAQQKIRCIPVGEGTPSDSRSSPRSHERIVAQCFTTVGIDIAAELVKTGNACDWVKFSGGHYSRAGGTVYQL